MEHNKSVEELRKMTENRRYKYLAESDVFTEKGCELYEGSKTDPYKSYELVNTDFQSEDGSE